MLEEWSRTLPEPLMSECRVIQAQSCVPQPSCGLNMPNLCTFIEPVATFSAALTVGFSHARYPSGKRASSIWMGHAATVVLSKAKLLQLDHRQKNPRSGLH